MLTELKSAAPERNCTFNLKGKTDYSEVLPAAFALAHRALAAAAILARPAALMVYFFLVIGMAAGLAFLTLAQRAFCAAAILARPAALILNFFFGAGAGVEAEPKMEASSFSKALISSLRSAACFSWAGVSDNRSFMVARE